MISILCLKRHKRVLMRWPFIQWWVLFLIVLSILLSRPIERLLHLGCNSVKTESNGWFISWCCTSDLLRILDRFLNILKHSQIVGMSCIFKSSNYWFFYCKLLYWIGRVSSKPQLCDLRRVPVLGVRIIRSCGLLWAQLVIALNNYCPKFKRSFLIWCFNID